MTLSIITEHWYAEFLSVTYKPFMLSVVMIDVVTLIVIIMNVVTIEI